jgi:NAD(P)H-dependent flavin oxidoreductase YrpB (nitropropane dioxygenase family)
VRDLVSGARGRQVYELGDPEYGIWSVGISAGLIHDIPTCEDLVRRMEQEAEELMDTRLRILTTRTRNTYATPDAKL